MAKNDGDHQGDRTSSPPPRMDPRLQRVPPRPFRSPYKQSLTRLGVVGASRRLRWSMSLCRLRLRVDGSDRESGDADGDSIEIRPTSGSRCSRDLDRLAVVRRGRSLRAASGLEDGCDEPRCRRAADVWGGRRARRNQHREGKGIPNNLYSFATEPSPASSTTRSPTALNLTRASENQLTNRRGRPVCGPRQLPNGFTVVRRVRCAQKTLQRRPNVSTLLREKHRRPAVS